MATALLLCDNLRHNLPCPQEKNDHSRVRVRLAKLKSKIRKPPLELFVQPRTGGKATDEKCELLTVNQEWCSGVSGYTDRASGKALHKVDPDRVHGGLDRGFEERRNLCAVCEKTLVPIR